MSNLSLCSGYGGLDEAVEQITGNKTLVYAEKDEFASRIMAARFPWAINLGDITTIDWRAIACDLVVDTVSAGFPCQDISHAGRKKGISGARSGIWKNVVEAVGVFRPRLVFLENVDAIRSRGLDVVVADLAAIGYGIRWTCLRADEVGAAHRRWRWTAVAHPAASDPERSGRYRWPRDLTEAQGRNEFADRGHAAAGAAGELNLVPSPTVADSRGTRNYTAKRRPGAKFNPGKTLTDFAWLLSDEAWVSVDGVDYGPAIRRWEQTLGRPAPVPTEAGVNGNRRITPAFTEWLMGLDEGWVTDVDIPRAKQLIALGNGVIPRQAVEGYRRLLTADLEALAA
ncbi:DNA cytosine methyltransferase [Streptomyces sp. NPDC014793]|uniref:DNA cytosine methyltransferase n=1 Tax=Streptomyces sp. NPDC014793 TaxID=3364914 RepID=UPI0036FE613D